MALILKEKGYNQNQFANMVGVNKSAVSYWIHAQKEPTLSNICKMLEVLNCSFDELME